MKGVSRMARRLSCRRGQSLLEFTLVMPFVLLVALGVSEIGYLLLDQHVVTKLAREGSNLISRSTSLADAAAALRTMSSRPVDFSNGSKVIFSVLKKGATTGTANYNQTILYQRYEYGTLSSSSTLQTRGGGSFDGANDYQAANSDNNTGLQVTNIPSNLINVRGGMIYVTEIYTTHRLITPLSRIGATVPTTLRSVAYF
jgi:hypothetical protein